MKKPVKYIIYALLIGLACYNAVYFEPLDEKNAKKVKGAFDPEVFVSTFMASKIDGLPAIETNELLQSLKLDLVQFTADKGRKLGISNDYYFVVEGQGEVLNIEEENVRVKLDDSSEDEVLIATDFIFGNTVREATGIANIGDYQNTMDFNNISVAINDRIRSTVIPPFSSKVKVGDSIYFKGAINVNTKSPNLDSLRIVPLTLRIQ